MDELQLSVPQKPKPWSPDKKKRRRNVRWQKR